jgi:hypothetical protein
MWRRTISTLPQESSKAPRIDTARGTRGEMTAMPLVHVNLRLGRAARVVYYDGVIEM